MISTGLRNMMARNIAVVQNGMFAAQAAPLRNFAKKGSKKAKKADGSEATVTEEEDAAVERETVAEPVKAAPVRAAMTGAAWSAGDIPQITSVEGHVCPVSE
jgi:hypothetical protein